MKKVNLKYNKNAYFLNGARQSIYLVCKNLKKNKYSEVLAPLFTCCVVISAIKEAGCKPIFYNNSLEDFQGILTKSII